MTARIYVASKAAHFAKWKFWRDVQGMPIISTWINEGEAGSTTDFVDLWTRCIREAATSTAVVLYREPGEHLKGALLEIGAAMGNGSTVYAVGEFDGSYHNHPLFVPFRDLTEAFAAACCHQMDAPLPPIDDLHVAFRGEQLNALTAAISCGDFVIQFLGKDHAISQAIGTKIRLGMSALFQGERVELSEVTTH